MIKSVIGYAVISVLSVGLIASCTSAPTHSVSSDAAASSQGSEASQAKVYTADGVAIRGADPVAYFEQGEPVLGSEEFAYEWMGVTWHFSSAENRDLFVNDPDAYAPQYGGYCAWAVAQGNLASVDPTAWAIVDDKLYLNFSSDIQARWQQDIPGNIAQADENWPGLSN